MPPKSLLFPQVVIGFGVGVLVPCAVGLLTGWLVGSSETSVAATIVPLVFSLLGVAGIGTAAKWFTATSIINTMMTKLGGSEGQSKLKADLEDAASEIARWPAMATLSAATMVFCASFYYGATFGVSVRVIQYAALTDTLEGLAVRDYEYATLSQFRNEMIAARIPYEEFHNLVTRTFAPTFKHDTLEYKLVSPVPEDAGPRPAPLRAPEREPPAPSQSMKDLNGLYENKVQFSPAAFSRGSTDISLAVPSDMRDDRFHRFFFLLQCSRGELNLKSEEGAWNGPPNGIQPMPYPPPPAGMPAREPKAPKAS